MSWSNEPPARYTLHFDWPKRGAPADGLLARSLIADTVEDAKLEAAILYASATTLPPAYRIVKGARRVVYRFPETAAH